MLKLNLGCGKNVLPEYLNIDVLEISAPNYIKHDLSKGLPDYLCDIDYIIQSHFLEHITPSESENLIACIFNKLKPGGILRLVLPDFRKMATAYVNNDYAFFDQALHMGSIAPLGSLLEVCRYGCFQYTNGLQEHKNIFDAEFTIAWLKTFGFEAKEVPYDTSIDPNTREREIYSFVVEARKPLRTS